MEAREDLLKLFPPGQRDFWQTVVEESENISEIRIRTDKPILVYRKGMELGLNREGKLITVIHQGRQFSYAEIQQMLDYWCQDSRYAFQEEIRRGFLTLRGGHRVGLTGEVVTDNNENIQTIKYISGLNIRLAHEVRNVAARVLPYLYLAGNPENTLIISPPGAGKTTLLRDILRRISDGNPYGEGKTVALVDERSEIAACRRGVPQLEVGLRTDVLDNCPKEVGMMLLLRSMAPQVLAVDELGSTAEVELLHRMTCCGCTVIATVHGSSLEEVREKKIYASLWEKRVFRYFLFLSRREGKYAIDLYKEGADTPWLSC
jgi:stage III sporulation protein AA